MVIYPKFIGDFHSYIRECGLESACSILHKKYIILDISMLLMSYIKFNFQVRDEIEHLMDDDGDMAEMYLTEKKQKSEAYALSDLCLRTDTSGGATEISKSAPVSPVESISGAQNPQRAFNRIFSMSKYGSLTGSSDNGENIEQLEMLLEAYFVVADNSLSHLLSV